MRVFALSSEAFTESVMVTSWPASANTCAMPWPMRPAPMTAMRALAMSHAAPKPLVPASGDPERQIASPAILLLGSRLGGNERESQCHRLPRRVTAVSVEDVAGVKVRRPGGEEQQRPRQVLRLAEPALRHTREEALAHR